MTTSERAPETVIRDLTDEINREDYDAFAAFFADDYADRYDNREVAAVVDEERERHEAFADKHEAVDTVLRDPDGQDGDHLSAWYTVTGTHEGEFLELPPTGNDVEFPLLRTFVVEDGAVTRYRVVYTLGFLLDLGLDWEALTGSVDMESYLTTPERAR